MIRLMNGVLSKHRDI